MDVLRGADAADQPEDVQEVMKGINADDPLEMLAALGHVSVTNPYELRLAGEGAEAVG